MRKIFWANKGKVIVIASVISLLIATKALAWGGAAWAPYAGELVWIYPGEFGPESVAYEMKWSQMALTIMRGWPQTDAILDQTADCTANSPDGNKLSAAWSFTNIPHYSVNSKNDCPWWDPWGPKEEVEMQMKTSNMQADYSYMWTVVWRPEKSAASGEINITAQRDQSEWQWLDKTLYSYGSGAAVANFSKISPKSNGVITTTRGFKEWYAYKVVSEGIGRLQAYVAVDFDNPVTLREYIAANRSLAAKLSATYKGEVPVTVTFAQPLSIEQVKILIAQTGFRLTAYYVTATNERGQRAALVVWPFNGTLEDEEPLQRAYLQTYGYRPIGIAVLVGWVPSPTGLAMLLQNSLAYLVDVVAADIAQNMGLELQDISHYMDVVVPTPYWNIKRLWLQNEN